MTFHGGPSDESVKQNMPVAYFVARESLRGENEPWRCLNPSRRMPRTTTNKKSPFGLFLLEKPNGLDALKNRKKVVMSQRRYERACKRIADANVPFCEKGGAAT